MTEEDIRALEMRYSESKIQHICVCWFRRTHPEIGSLLYAVPNGGARTPTAAAMMKYEGAVSGVADLCLAVEKSLYIEMKVPKRPGSSAGRQSANQKEWGALAERHGNRYVVCHGIAEFVRAVCTHLNEDAEAAMKEVCDKYPTYR